MPGINPSKPITTAVKINTLGLLNSWLSICSLMLSCELTRVTITPAAVEIINDGICATKPSPIVNNT